MSAQGQRSRPPPEWAEGVRRAVSAEAGEPYKDRLLALPAFLNGRPAGDVTRQDVEAGFALTGHFLEARVLRPRGLEMPEARSRLMSYLRRNA